MYDCIKITSEITSHIIAAWWVLIKCKNSFCVHNCWAELNSSNIGIVKLGRQIVACLSSP